MSVSDRSFARRLREGDAETLDAFFANEVPRLYRFALRRMQAGPEAAEEVVQATLVKAIEKLDTFRGDASLFTWLCTICRNEIEDGRNRVWRRRETPLPEDDAQRSALPAPADAAHDPEARVLADEHSARVHAVLDALPEPYGDVLEWKYVEGLSVKAIAARLGISPKAAESSLTRARVAFRKAFGDASDGSDR